MLGGAPGHGLKNVNRVAHRLRDGRPRRRPALFSTAARAGWLFDQVALQWRTCDLAPAEQGRGRFPASGGTGRSTRIAQQGTHEVGKQGELMTTWLSFLLGLVAGGALGILVAALCTGGMSEESP